MTDSVTRTVRDVQEDDGDVYVLGLRESTLPGAWSLLFMPAEDEPDEQDVDLDMDTYCTVSDPGQATHYGGILECEFAEESLRLRLGKEAASTLGLAEREIWEFQVSAEQMQMARAGLRRVLTSGRSDERPTLRGL
jgi:hypothetical protein